MERKITAEDRRQQPESLHEGNMAQVKDPQADLFARPTEEKKRLVDLGLLEDDEAAALGNLTIIAMLLYRISEEGQSGTEDISLFLQEASHRAADMLCDSYRVLRERMLEFTGKEAREVGNID